MKKILFGITSLTIGGAERVLIDLTNVLSKDYDITILTVYPNGELEKELNKDIKVISIYNKTFKEFNKLEKLKNSIELLFMKKPPINYDIYVAFLEGPITRLFSKQAYSHKKKKNNQKQSTNQAKKIAWIHNDISKVFGKGLKSTIKKCADKRIYKKYDTLVFVSNENKEDFNKQYGNEFNEIVIRNYLNYNDVLEKAKEPIDLPYKNEYINLVSVCRLVNQKAIDRFIKVHANLEKEGIHSKVYIIGDGPERNKLKQKIKEYKEENNFYLLGAKKNPYPYIKDASYFCLLSYYEGYGMVLDEAKILDKTIIITDTAARESIENYDKGIILDNSEKGIHEGLKKMLNRDIIIEKFKENDNIKNIEEYYNNIILKVKTILD